MAKIPIEQSNLQITTQAPAVRQGGGVFSTAIEQQTQRLGQAVTDIAQRFENARTLAETTKANNFSKRQLGELKLEAEKVDDFNNFQQFTDKISKIREDSVNLISIPRAKSEFQRLFDRDALSAEFSIKNTLRNRVVDDAKTQMFENIELIKGNSIDRETELSDLLTKNVNNLIIKKEAAFKLREKTLKDWQESDIRDAIADDALLARNEIVKGEFGKLSASETADWLKTADNQIKYNEKVAQKSLNQKWLVNSGELIKNLDDKSEVDIINSIVNGEIDPAIGQELLKAKSDPKVLDFNPNSGDNKKIWLEIVENSTTPEEDLRKIQKKISTSIAKGNISVKDGGILEIQIERLFDEAINFKIQPNKFIQALKTSIGAIRNWANITTNPAEQTQRVYDMVKQLLTGTEDVTPEQVTEISNKIIQEKQKELNPLIDSADKQGTLMIDAFGNKARVFPDGRIKEVE